MKGSCRLPLLLATVTTLAYLNAFGGVFQFDDYNVIVNYTPVHSWAGWLADLPRGIRPFLKLTYTANWTSGLGLFGFHLVNLAIHLAATLLILGLSRRLAAPRFPDAAPAIAAATALLFAIHPVQTEAVTYICGRSSSLMALCYLGSLAAYARGREEERPLLFAVVSPLLFLLALAAKETAVTLPLALLLWEVATSREKVPWRAVLRDQAIHWLLLAGVAILLLAHPRYRELLLFSITLRTAAENLHGQVAGIWYLLGRLFLVTRLSVDPQIPLAAPWSPADAARGLLLALLAVAGPLFLRRHPLTGFALCWFFLQLLPTNSLVPRLDVANERQLYLAGWGALLLAAMGSVRLLQALPRQRVALRTAGVCLLVLLGGATALRNRDYQSEAALWEGAARLAPDKARVFNNLGYAYLLAGRPGDAAQALRRAVALDPVDSRARGNLERATRELGAQALRAWEAQRRFAPTR